MKEFWKAWKERFRSTNKNNDTTTVENYYRDKDRETGNNGNWFKYLFIFSALLIISTFAISKYRKKEFNSYSKKTKAKVLLVKFNFQPDGSGMSSTGYGFDRIEYQYNVENKTYKNYQDIVNFEYKEYFESDITKSDSIFIIYDSRNPQHSKIQKLKE
ncbi:hypothetical protein A9Q93_11870 [Nonlabens dokdonensis]|uniref:DUF3592 domain containing protein n=1 Tax=Nonlabens dokdonensis TaxID=328515 RepID=A0A1Z8ALE1_9FLAO|nr:hypothetical protein [Nonlabens dokdonensis]OUS11164.1 hypothetical protein A9Q93_11870 [Nonlabens dokdonensis]